MAKRMGPASGSRKRGKPPWGAFIYQVRVTLGMLPPLRRPTYWRVVLKLLLGRPLSAGEAPQIAHHAALQAGVVVVWQLLVPDGDRSPWADEALPSLKERLEAARAAGRN